MSMFCFQCQEAAKGFGCEVKGVCGKTSDVANLQDLLLFVTKGVAWWSQQADEAGIDNPEAEKFIIDSMFITITNANFDRNKIIAQIRKGFNIQDNLARELGKTPENTPECAVWRTDSEEAMEKKSTKVGVLSHKDEDIRSLKELLTYGMKGMAAYAEHAHNLGYHNEAVNAFIKKGLVATVDETLGVDELLPLVLECGKYGVEVMSLLDKANTESYGHPEITSVNLGVGKNPGILVSGHDLKDFEELLKQTEGTGVDVYTHSEMLPANYYPAFKKYKHFVGNYGNSWWKQTTEFESFNGPVLLTTNCLVPPKENYKNRVYTTGAAGFDGCVHIPDRKDGKPKDFSLLIEHAKKCKAPTEIETGEIVGGFAHNQVIALADKVVEAVKSGAIKKFVVMAGCDGRVKARDYYTDFASELPQDTVILTAGCAKYRYNKLQLGDIGGIPRILDAGQCNDSYSLAVIALKLKEVFGLDDINELPIVYNIAWYEQKAVIVLLALLSLGVKNIHLGPTLPAFLSPNVTKVLVEQFGIGSISTVEEDMAEMIGATN
ncbi:hydroxylamine reductase [Anaerophaga thermohalophila]|uniref:hydroxylamine reductase n=1 Tax=Anaerophaga thermohalophila TaxID=177400 RepID=UPI0003069356|nr:hydroxylamine reductase [Anaerophaga thermohalophila]